VLPFVGQNAFTFHSFLDHQYKFCKTKFLLFRSKRKNSVSGKRAYKNAKYGFGGRKKTSKWNTKESFDNIGKKSNKKFAGGKVIS